MADLTDVEVRIQGAKPGVDPSLRDVEVRVDRSGCWSGQSRFDLDSLDPSDPAKYGEALGRQLANPSLLRALDQAGLTRGGDIRLRLWLDDDPTVPHWVRWERISLDISGASWRLAVHPRVAFSRYIPVEQPDGNPPDTIFFRLLFAIANPVGLKPSQMIDVEREIGSFLEEFENRPADRRLQVTVFPGHTGLSQGLQGRIAKQGWSVISGNTTLQDLSAELHKRYHGLHILAHGDFNPRTGVGTLLLENDAGGKDEVHDPELQSWITNDLQLIVFQACLSAGAPAEGQPPFTGLAPRLIRLGLPAAVAMQDYVAMSDARTFFSEFYRTLLDDGLADVAVNRGRQRLIESAALDNWSIPALFSRLKGGRLWLADAIRQSILTALDNLASPISEKWPALQVIEHTRGVTKYDPLQGASGPCFDLWNRLRDLASTADAFVILTGATGSSKAAQVLRLFRDMGEQFRNARTSVLPVLLSLGSLTGEDCPAWPVLERIWNGRDRQSDRDRVHGREFLFLIDAEEELNGPLREQALAAVNRLRALPGSRVIMVADEVLLPALASFGRAKLLVAQPLDYPRIVAYLDDLGTEAARTLCDLLRTRGYRDLASQPRFLGHMLELLTHGISLKSRRGILENVSAIYLARMDTRRVPRVSVENAVQQIAWQIQNGRGAELDGSAFYASLISARAGREFPLAELKHALVEECGLLTPSGSEGVRFVYAPMQAYFAARYLALAPDRARLLEDITASLGRLSRLRRWEKTLVLLGSMLPSPADLLRTILAGSSLMEGEQLFLAARCYQEAIAEHKDGKNLEDVLNQIVDTLIWRCSWDPSRPYGDRHQALEHLIELAVVCEVRQGDIIAHLIALAFDEVPASGGAAGLFPYDWSGMRRTAAYGLSRLEAAPAYVAAHRPDLVDLMNAWAQLRDYSQPMKDILLRDSPSLSVIAALAIARTCADGDTLLEAYQHSRNKDVRWGIADAISGLEAAWVQQKVVEPWMEAAPGNDPDSAALRAAHICYLLQKTSFANDKARAYLSGCLQSGPASLQGRALRAFAKLQDPEVESWLRPLCEQILCRTPNTIDPARFRLAPTDIGNPDLARSALEVLRDIGDGGSIDAVRTRRGQAGDNELRQLSFQVAEEIYWRLSGGLGRESFLAAAFHKTTEEEL